MERCCHLTASGAAAECRADSLLKQVYRFVVWACPAPFLRCPVARVVSVRLPVRHGRKELLIFDRCAPYIPTCT